MSDTVLAILLVTSSAKGSSVVYRWPPTLPASKRLCRPFPDNTLPVSHLDNPWRASHPTQVPVPDGPPQNDPPYSWQTPAFRATEWSGGRDSPSKTTSFEKDEYEHIFGYPAEFLANILCPQRSMCHQKFELIVDDLAFLGHPVCAEVEVERLWRFRPDKLKPNARGRGSRHRNSPANETSASPDGTNPEKTSGVQSSWLQTFHFAMVLDLPDPSSSESGNISRYFDVIYEQLAFPITAVLFQEQVLSNFVELECDVLGSLKDSCISKGEPFSKFMSDALEASSIAPAMKALYTAIKSSSMAYISINSIPLELQLPPHLDQLLRSEDDEIDLVNNPVNDGEQAWGPELSYGWNLPSLAPWKSLLLLDTHDGFDPYMLRGPFISSEDRNIVEGLIRFLESASVTLSLADMSSLLDWDLKSQTYPAVRWLVLHRRAKVVDIVHPGLKTVFTLPPRFDSNLAQLAADFEKQFSHPSIPPLPEILSVISASSSKQGDNHFFASVVHSKELIPLFHDVAVFLLKKELVVTLHLRIRIVATRALKLRVKLARMRTLGKKSKSSKSDDSDGNNDNGHIAWVSLSPQSARRHSQRLSSSQSISSDLSALNLQDENVEEFDDENPLGSEDDSDAAAEDNLTPSLINDPSGATPLQRLWLSAMSEGKEPEIARRFEHLNRYFDGKKTDDEILFRAEITRKQLREVLHHYEEYLQTFLHPS